jgi:hypothetical protein
MMFVVADPVAAAESEPSENDLTERRLPERRLVEVGG